MEYPQFFKVKRRFDLISFKLEFNETERNSVEELDTQITKRSALIRTFAIKALKKNNNDYQTIFNVFLHYFLNSKIFYLI